MRSTIFFMFLFVAIGVGCSRQDVPVQQDAVEEADPRLEQMQSHVKAIEAESGLYTALEFGITAMSDWEDHDLRWDALDWLVSYVQRTDDIHTTLLFVRELLTLDEQMAGWAVVSLDERMMKLDPSAWLGFLQDYSMPSEFRAHGFRLWFRYYAEDATVPELIGALVVLQDPTLEEYLEGVFGETLHKVLLNREAQEIWDVLGVLRGRIPQESLFYEIVVVMQGKAYLRDAMMSAALAHYQEHAELLGDVRLLRGVSALFDHVSVEGDLVLEEQIREWGYGLEGFPMTRNRIARWDLEQLRGKENVAVVLDGVRDVLHRGASVAVIANVFLGEMLYSVLSGANAEEQQALRDLLLEMLAAEADMSVFVRTSLELALLDVYFYLEDYKGVLARVDMGIPGYDEDWHAELRNKVEAHLAEQEGRIADAVAHYQKHIERVKTWTEPFVSPEDGRNILPYEVVALNERRISDLWAGEGETEKADAARARAITYYRLARDAYADDAQSVSKMEQVLREMGVE